ncbi:MAG: protein translocase subunit SecF, partial [Candidatus Daviesbacteria bacterium]|nr:protein translocase subunit SecF [Candidatus Daviesbacteria bacterium]
MEFFNPKANYDFISKRNFFVSVSMIAVFISLVALFKPGLKFGIDFSGGTEVQVKFLQHIDSKEVRKIIEDSGFKDSSVQLLGSEADLEYLIRLEQSSGNLKS